MLKKIVVIGPESTGKSTLCTQLAEHFNTKWAPEYAREYLLKNGTDYSYDDLLTIAKGQLALEDEYASKVSPQHPTPKGQPAQPASDSLPIAIGIPACRFELPIPTPLFIDTDMYVMKVWCEFVFGKCHQFILDEIATRKYDLYLLCNTDLPWVQDELREYPDLETREKLYKIYKDILLNQTTPWVEISGGYEERLRIAISAVANII